MTNDEEQIVAEANGSFAGTVAFVTGAGSGIGRTNAGAEQKPNATADIAEEEWDRIIAIDLTIESLD